MRLRSSNLQDRVQYSRDHADADRRFAVDTHGTSEPQSTLVISNATHDPVVKNSAACAGEAKRLRVHRFVGERDAIAAKVVVDLGIGRQVPRNLGPIVDADDLGAPRVIADTCPVSCNSTPATSATDHRWRTSGST